MSFPEKVRCPDMMGTWMGVQRFPGRKRLVLAIGNDYQSRAIATFANDADALEYQRFIDTYLDGFQQRNTAKEVTP